MKTIERYLLEDRGLRPRTLLKKMFLRKAVLLNGRPAKRTDMVGPGDRVELLDDEDVSFAGERHRIEPNAALKLKILEEDPSWVLAYKPGGMHAHPQKKSESGTALNAIISAFPECAEPGRPARPLEGLLVHRIDQGTSGILLCARSVEAFARLRAAWVSGNVTKVYLAWVDGALERPGMVSCFLAHDPKSKKKMKAFAPQGLSASSKSWPAVTSFFPLLRVRGHTLALIQIHTGVTHQIRATLAALGHCVLGDPVYKPYARPLELERVPLTNKQLALFERLGRKIRHKKTALPREGSLPENAFFLHALYLRLDDGKAGIDVFSAAPEYF